MKKVIRLTESDLMRIVKRVIEEQSLNEISPITYGKYAKSKRNTPKDTPKNSPYSAIDILKSVKKGEVEDIKPIGGSNKDPLNLRKVEGFEFNLEGHKISVQHRTEITALGFLRDFFLIFVDGEDLKSDSDTVEKIIKKLKDKN